MDRQRRAKRNMSEVESPLKTEREYFAKSIAEWVKSYDGKVALVKGESLIGVYDTELSAIAVGARLYGRDLLLVRRIQSKSSSVQAPLAYTLGLLSGNSSPPTGH